MSVDELLRAYIEKFGGIPWTFNNFTDEQIRDEIEKALITQIPFREEELNDGEDL